jgi:peptidyl-prolyl cis-trans isomerase A (cyclophilin A)
MGDYMLIRSVVVLLALSIAAGSQTPQTAKPATAPAAKKAAAKTSKNPVNPTSAILHTTDGDMKCELFPDKTPRTVANFVDLATGKKDWTDPATKQIQHSKPLYDGVIFHRTIPGFMIQGGDPTGSGSGDIGFQFEDELLPDLLFDKPGRLAMANHGPNTNSSQFFITETTRSSLDPCLTEEGCQRPWGHVPKGSGYTIFGQCDDAAVALVKQIASKPCTAGTLCAGANSRPVNPVKIDRVEIFVAGKSINPISAPKKAAPASGAKLKTSPKKGN